ncbi:MAG: HEAT repeat domain-containing protein [Ktedonobacteraceae bacterium]
MPSEQAISLLVERLKEPDAYESSMQELIALGSSAVPALIDALTNSSQALSVRLGAASALGEIRDERAIVPLISVFNLTTQGGEPQDYYIIPALVRFGVLALPHLVPVLTDPKRDVLTRAAAARALGNLGEPLVLEVLVERLKDANESIPVRSSAASALGELGERGAVAPLMDILSQETDELLRQRAVIALGKLGDQRAVELLIKVLQMDQSIVVRLAVPRALGLIGDERVIAPLIEAVTQEKVTFEVHEALEQFGTPALQAVLAALETTHDKPLARGTLVRTLGYFEQEEAFTRLLTILEDEHEASSVRTAAALALGLQQDYRASKPLLALLESHKDLLLRSACAVALGILADPETLPVLQKLLRDEPETTPWEKQLKKAIETAIKRINLR